MNQLSFDQANVGRHLCPRHRNKRVGGDPQYRTRYARSPHQHQAEALHLEPDDVRSTSRCAAAGLRQSRAPIRLEPYPADRARRLLSVRTVARTKTHSDWVTGDIAVGMIDLDAEETAIPGEDH